MADPVDHYLAHRVISVSSQSRDDLSRAHSSSARCPLNFYHQHGFLDPAKDIEGSPVA
ncbi:MAG: hypothetical protein ACRDDA_06360 [Aeromonas sp.]